jgi:pyruvate-ferredoxin/flavodoxin oxidoreductase
MLRRTEKNPFVLDSPRPKIRFKDYAYNELRYKMLTRTNPQEAERLITLAQEAVDMKWRLYEDMATQAGHRFQPSGW